MTPEELNQQKYMEEVEQELLTAVIHTRQTARKVMRNTWVMLLACCEEKIEVSVAARLADRYSRMIE